MPPSLALARDLLERHFGHPRFRPLQARVVSHVLAGHDTLAVLPTGAGKSACFQVPALAVGGVTVVVSPLLSLMADQVAAANRRGISAGACTGAQPPAERRALLRAAAAGTLRLLYAAPEGLPRLARELAALEVVPSRLAIDEAHCISEWGHDFRPAYRAIAEAAEALEHPPMVALTGSATPAVQEDTVSSLRLGVRRPLQRVIGSFDRPNLWFGTRQVRDTAERRAVLRELLAGAGGIALVYAPTRGLVEGIVKWLRRTSVPAEAYHAGLPLPHRARVLERFLAGDAPVVVATCAFGMGIDRPDVRLVVHWALPATVESYYQEAGRAGRDGGPARCIALVGAEDARWQPPAVRRLVAAPCLRAALVGHFGEELAHCAGCERCDGNASRLARYIPTQWKRSRT